MKRSKKYLSALMVLALAAVTLVTLERNFVQAAPTRLASQQPASQQATPSPMRYVALGDSFTSAPLVPVTDPADGCYRSSNNYPHLLAQALQPASFTDVSCSGAHTNHVFTEKVPSRVSPQLQAVGPDTTLVTVGLGGNDEDLFMNLLSTCAALAMFEPAGQPCTDHFTSLGQETNPSWITTRTALRMVNVIASVRARAPQARIVVVGYPVLTPAVGTCENMPIAEGDYPYVRAANQRLNAALHVASFIGGADFIDAGAASQGHDVCSDQPWVNGPLDDPARAQAFHPFLEHQQGVAHMIAELL